MPLAALLWKGGMGFGGVIAFIYADLLILPILNSYGRYYGARMAALRDRRRTSMRHPGLRDNAVPAMKHSPFVPGAVRKRGPFRRRFAELPRLRRLDMRSNRIARLADWGVRVPSLEKLGLRWKPCELSPWPLTGTAGVASS